MPITTDSTPPIRLAFRSESGRTEVAVLPNGDIAIRVLGGKDQLGDMERIRLAAALGAYGPGPEDLAEFDRTNRAALDQTR
jgi:hypothetical protein